MSNYSVKHISSQASNDHKDAQYFDSDKHSEYTVSANDIHAAADTKVFTSDGLCFKRNDNDSDTVMVCGLASAATASHVVVPARTSHLGLTVTALGKACFSHSRLKGITLPPTIEEICDNAFEASAIERLTLSSNIIRLGKQVFADCSKLSEINLTSTRVRVIENKAFMNCGSLKKIQLPIGLESIEDSAFENCISLEEMQLPSVQTLGKRVFHNCQSMISFEGKSVTDIGEDAFGKCLSLSKIAACDYIEDNIHLIKETALYQNANYNVAGVKVVLGSVIEVAQPKFSLYSTPLPPNTKVIESFAFENFAGDIIELPKSIRLLKPHALVQKSDRKVMSENGNIKTVKGGYQARARVIYEGSIAGWNRIDKLRSDTAYSVVVTCEEGNVTFIDYI